MSEGYFCSSCSTNVSSLVALGGKVSRTESCSKCREDLHSCIHCTYYDPNSYNECRESQAERVTAKERSNFCDYFSFQSGKLDKTSSELKKKKSLKDLDDLFK